MSLRPTIPFTHSFSCPQGTNTIEKETIIGRELSNFFVYIEDDNKGPVYINAYLVMLGAKYPLANGSIYDGAGPNRQILTSERIYPIDRGLGALITIEYSNYCGENITSVKFGWFVRR